MKISSSFVRVGSDKLRKKCLSMIDLIAAKRSEIEKAYIDKELRDRNLFRASWRWIVLKPLTREAVVRKIEEELGSGSSFDWIRHHRNFPTSDYCELTLTLAMKLLKMCDSSNWVYVSADDYDAIF